MPPNFKNRTTEYEIRTDVKETNEKQLQTVVASRKFQRELKDLLPTMAVKQKMKRKDEIRVLDFRKMSLLGVMLQIA